MNNDSKIKFTSFNIIVAIFLSLVLHLIFFTKFNLFDLLNTVDRYETNELEIFVTPEEKKGNLIELESNTNRFYCTPSYHLAALSLLLPLPFPSPHQLRQ